MVTITEKFLRNSLTIYGNKCDNYSKLIESIIMVCKFSILLPYMVTFPSNMLTFPETLSHKLFLFAYLLFSQHIWSRFRLTPL